MPVTVEMTKDGKMISGQKLDDQLRVAFGLPEDPDNYSNYYYIVSYSIMGASSEFSKSYDITADDIIAIIKQDYKEFTPEDEKKIRSVIDGTLSCSYWSHR